jgi:hypothetical protein
MSNDIDLPVRQAAVIYLKNMVSDTEETNDLISLFCKFINTFHKELPLKQYCT